MQEEVTQKTIVLVIKILKLTASTQKAAMKMYLNHRKQKAQKTYGKTSVKKLVGEGVRVSSVEVSEKNILYNNYREKREPYKRIADRKEQ